MSAPSEGELRPNQVRVAVIVVAAGQGSRLAVGDHKAFAMVSGRTILEHALESVFGMSEPAQVVVVAPADSLDRADSLARGIAASAADYVSVIPGGDSRQASVRLGLAAVLPGVEVVLVHDAARSLTPSSLFDSVVRAVAESGAGIIPGLPVTDTIKRIAPDNIVGETVDRSQLAAVQTPQGFPLDLLADAYARAEREYTDDAAVFSAAGNDVRVIPGDPLAFKITTQWDLRRAEQLLAPSEEHQSVRSGIGIDVHAFADGRELWLAGLNWPGERGLAGHSDADVVCHAICDALLSAAGLGDIGSRFGTSDPAANGAHGDYFLRGTLEILTEAGFAPTNVSVQLIAVAPKFAPRRLEAEALLSAILGAPVSVSATTSDGLGFTGRGEGIAAIASALVRSTN